MYTFTFTIPKEAIPHRRVMAIFKAIHIGPALDVKAHKKLGGYAYTINSHSPLITFQAGLAIATYLPKGIKIRFE